jgi:hypothetical protein
VFDVAVPDVAVIVGAILSITVTVALQVLWLPEASLNFTKTVFSPLLEQLKLVLLSIMIKLPEAVQLSVDPSLTSAEVNVAIPELFRDMVAGLQLAVGARLSKMVIVKEHGLLVLFAASLAV